VDLGVLEGPGSRRAFSLIELLVVIGVVAALMGILVPVLSSVRSSGRRTEALSNLRGAGVAFELYVGTYRSVYPFIAPGVFLQNRPPEDGPGNVRDSDPWAAFYAWCTVFHAVAPWHEHYATWVNRGRLAGRGTPWDDEGSLVWPSFRYATGFIARPEVWIDGTDLPAAETAPISQAEVRFPSAKALLFDADRAYLGRDARPADPRNVALADGSAAGRLDADAVPPAVNRFRGTTMTYHDTPEGVRGRDVR